MFDIEFDFYDHQLLIREGAGAQRVVTLEAKPVSRFYAETITALDELGFDVPVMASPVEVERAIPFEDDHEHVSYDRDAVRRFWGQLVQAHRVMTDFRSRFIGKVSPVHFFWGGLDLAVTRFCGRTAPAHPGGAPTVGDWVMVEGYSHELSSCGFWPGGADEGAFYAYSYPEPDGFNEHPVGPDAAFYKTEAGQFLLPYEAVRTAADPDAALLEFLQTTYEAAADNAGWDRDALEDDPDRRASPR